MASSGTKVSDPTAPPVTEGTGTVTSDSLAAESVKSGGSFASGNLKSGISSQSSAGTTTNNTNTSGATTLDSAPTAEAREAQEGWSETAQLNAGRDLGSGAGVGPTYNTKTGSGANVGIAPSYVTAGGTNEAHQKPHGKNISEGGFDSSAPNASFSNDIGGKNDPGRVAENKFQQDVAHSAYDTSTSGQKQTGVSNDGQYKALDETSA